MTYLIPFNLMKIGCSDMKENLLKIHFRLYCDFIKIRHVAMARSLAAKEDIKNIPLMVEEDEEVDWKRWWMFR